MNKNFVLDAKTEVEALIRDAFAAAEAQGKLQGGQPLPAFTVEIPADSSHGDFATNAAMVSAKTFRSAPVKIAGALVECMDFSKARYIDRDCRSGLHQLFCQPGLVCRHRSGCAGSRR